MGFYAKSLSKKKTSSNQDYEDLIKQILEKSDRISSASDMPQVPLPKQEEPWLAKVGNVLSTGQKLTTKTARDLLIDKELPTLEEYKQVSSPSKSYSNTELLTELGMEDGLKKKLLGLGLDIFADPTNLIPMSAVGKVVGKASKAGEALPLIGKGFKAVNEGAGKLAKLANQARKITPYEKDSLNQAWMLLNGSTSRAGTITDDIMKKYKAVFKGVGQLSEDRFPIIMEAVEVPKLRGALKPAEQEWVKGFRSYLKETGAEKETMGVIKEMIGNKKFDTKQLNLPLTQADLADNMAEQVVYNPHLLTKEAREQFKELSALPDEMRKVMSGMVKKNLPTMEKRRTLMGTINSINEKYLQEKGYKLFEDNPNEVLKGYQYAFAKRKALFDVNQDLMKIVDETGNPIIKKMGKEPTEGMVKLAGLPYKEGYEATPELAKMINRVQGVFASDELTNKFMKAYDKVLNTFKYSVTMPWPSFNLNNLMGATFNNWIYSASSMKEFPEAMAITLGKPAIIKAKNGATTTARELLDEMSKRGALNTFTKVETGSGGALKKILESKPVRGYAISLPNNIEKVVRTQLALDVYKKTGSFDKAAKAIWEVHGNYTPEFLSGFEKNIMSRVFPFWRWMRTSIPYQLENLYKQTGKYAAVAKVENAIMPNEERKNLPSYLQNKIITQNTKGADGKSSIRTADLPIMDLQKLTSARDMASGISPLIKIPTELTFNKQLFTDSEIKNKDLPVPLRTSKVSSPIETLPIIKNILGVKEVQKENYRTGEMEPRQEINSTVQYLLQNAGPISSLSSVSKRTQRELEKQGIETNLAKKLSSYILGAISPIKVYNVDSEEEKYNKLLDLNSRLQDIINYGIPRGMIERKN